LKLAGVSGKNLWVLESSNSNGNFKNPLPFIKILFLETLTASKRVS
jgi:hypothetical protein